MPWFMSDIHFHEYPRLATYKNGINSRLESGVDLLRQITDLALASGDTNIYLLGDLFYDRTGVSTVVMSNVTRAFRTAVRRGVRFTAIPGNHDYAPGGEVHHALHCLSKHISVVPKTTVDDNGVGLIPFTSSSKSFLESCEYLDKAGVVLLGVHQGFNGCDVDTNWSYFIDEIAKVSDLPDVPLLAGHYHNHGRIGQRGFHLGCPHQLQWGDEGIKKYVWQVNLTAFKVVQKVRLKSPRFKTIEAKTLEDVKAFPFVEGNFVRLKVAKDFPVTEATDFLKKAGAAAVDQPVYVVNELVQGKMQYAVDKVSKSMTPGSDFTGVIKEFAQHFSKIYGMDPKDLLKVGLSLLEDTNNATRASK